MKAKKMSAKKLVAFIFCIIMTLAVCCMVSSAEETCDHSAYGYEWVTTSQTCTTAGKKELVCRNCGTPDEQYTEVIPPHFFEVAFTAKEANCIETGLNVEYCAVCMTYRNVDVPVNTSNHNYGEWTVESESTCTTQGERYRLCRRNGCPDPRQTEKLELDYTAHVAKEDAVWETVYDAGCTYTGIEKTVCEECNKDFHRDIPSHIDATDGSLTEADFNAKYILESETQGTCSKPGVKKYVCGLCGTNVPIETEIVSDNHNFDGSEWIVSVPATCTTAGERYKTCKNNYGHRHTEEYYEDHDYSIELSFTPGDSCTSEGSKEVKCSVCSETEIVSTPAEHIFADWQLTGSCLTGGTATRSCLCNTTETTEFKAGTHLNYEVKKDMKPTCTDNGHIVIYCRDCKADAAIIPEGYAATGHTLAAWLVTKKPTCTESGYRTRSCRTCSQIVAEEIIAQQEHTFHVLEEGVEATCTKSGITPYLLCTKCFLEKKQDVIPATGHNFVKQSYDGDSGLLICDRCFEYQVENDVTCSCMCHNTNGIAKTLYKIVTFFNKLFGTKQFCDCGAQHYEDTSIFEDLFGSFMKK